MDTEATVGSETEPGGEGAANAPAPWPSGRGSREALVSQFGASRADLAAWALTTGDPLADAVAEEIREGGRPVREALQRGIALGLAALEDPPPAVAALLTETETVPDFVDDELLEHASGSYFDVPVEAQTIALSAGSLVRVYESPSIAEVLTLSGRLIESVPRRIEDTGRWVITAMLPGSLRPGRPGYVGTLQVRMMHAHMRVMARRKGYDEANLGVPVNQVDLARTWMDFTLTAHHALDVMGYEAAESDRADLYRYWDYLAHLLGIDARLVRGIRGPEQARRVDDLLQAVTGPLIPEAGELSHATLKSIAGTLRELVRVPEALGIPALHALSRRFHGDARGDALELKRSAAADAVLTPGIAAIRVRQARLRSDPRALRARRARSIARARENLAAFDQRPNHAEGADPHLPVPRELVR